MPVSAVFENLEAGAAAEKIIEQSDITREQTDAVLEFAARSWDAPTNGDLLAEAEGAGFDVLLTARPGSYAEVEIPYE